MRKIDSIIIHHSATNGGTVESIRKYHIEHNKWDDIGYHYVIEIGGCVKDGRPLLTKGAHCYGYNSSSIGICLVGKTKFDKEQTKSLKHLLSLLMDSHKITKDKIYGHNEFSSKACPGFDMNIIREFL